MRLLAAICATMFLVACADTHRLIRDNTAATVRLSPTDSIFIAVPEDGVYGAETYTGSGRNTSQIIYSAFAKHTRLARTGRSTQSYSAALKLARQAKYKFLVYPTILHWEDRATEWTGKRDKIEVKLELVNVLSGKVVQSALVTGRSKWATLGGDHPQDLLPKPVSEFVSSMY